MAELLPPGHFIGGGVGALGGADRLGVGLTIVTSSEAVVPKRQRRPSVRLGEIGGDQFYEPHHRRSNSSKQWKYNQFLPVDNKKDPNKNSKTRALTNLTTSGEFAETLDDEKEANLETEAIRSWKARDSKKRASNATIKRVRSNWATKIDDSGGGNNNHHHNITIEEDDKYSEDMDDTYMENSESPSHSLENLGDGNERNDRGMYCNRRSIRFRDDGVELSGPSETYARDDRNGVRIWLNSIGLGRYAAVFEIHEVDDEVLPMLTLEDLKDMGINAVGSRRKMFCAIQKLGRGFS